ncbi:MAG: response regulator [Pseudomonadota bacterium]
MSQKVLIVEEEPDILKVLENVLTEEGLTVKCAPGAEKAIELFESEPFDLVITDIRMSGMNGLELMQKLKELDEDVEVIILTGYASLEGAVLALRHDGAFDYLTKPLEYLDTLINTTARALERCRLRRKNKGLLKELRLGQMELEIRNEKLRKVQDELKGDRDKYLNLYDLAPVGYLILSKNNLIREANLTGARLLGIERSSLIKRDFSRFIAPDFYDTFYSHKNRVLETRTRQLCELQLLREDQSTFWSRLESVVILDHKGNPFQLRTAITDINVSKTEEKRMQMQLLKVKHLESLGTLAGGIAHEFNNALTVIYGNIQLLEKDFSEDKKVQFHLSPMVDSIQRMTRLTKKLLAYARGGKYRERTISFTDLLRDMRTSIQLDMGPSIHLEIDLPEETLYVKADPDQMEMMISAVVRNALEAFEDKGQIRISVRKEETGEGFAKKEPGISPGTYFCMTIEDDGKGMDEETRNRIFEPFFSTKFRGRGLGMAAVYGIVKNHGGYIYVDSQLGKGTVVRIYLPVAGDQRIKPEGSGAEITQGTGTILIIEDEEEVMKVTRAMLMSLGYRTLEARTGLEAVHIARSFDGEIDLALLDMKLPDMEGGQVYPIIKGVRPDMKVIVCSGYALDGPVQEVLDAGAGGFIQKPFRIEPLSRKIWESLKKE